jgi:hypothetical protein
MKNIWTILCSKSSVDAETNSLSLFDCIDQITINFIDKKIDNEKKKIPIYVELVGLWLDDDESSNGKNYDLLIEFIGPNDKTVNKFVQEFNFEPHKRRMRTIIKIQGMEITSEGTYKFLVKHKEKNKNVYTQDNEIPLDVKFV